MAKSPQAVTRTQSVSTTKMALATLAMVAAAGASLVAVPANNTPATPPNQCIPMNIEFSQPCNAVVSGQPGTVPGFRRMRYFCPGGYSAMVSVGSCRSEQKMYNDAAVNCQRRNECALPGYGYGAVPDLGYGYAQAVQQALPPVISFAADSPGSNPAAVFQPGANSIIALVHVENPNNAAMTIQGMNINLYGGGVALSTTTRWVNIADQNIYGRGVNARAQWATPRLNGGLNSFNFLPGQFVPSLIPARSSSNFYVTLSLNGLQRQWNGQEYLVVSLPANAVMWSLQNQAGVTSILNGTAERYLIRPSVTIPSVAWSWDTPQGPSSPSLDSIIARFLVTNSPVSQDPLIVQSVKLFLQENIFAREDGQQVPVNASLYEGNRLLTRFSLSPESWDPRTGIIWVHLNAQDFFEIQPGASKTLTVHMDTTLFRSSEAIAASVRGLEYSSVNSHMIYNTPFQLPIKVITF